MLRRELKEQWQAWQHNNKRQAYAEFEVMDRMLSDGKLDAAMDNFQTLQDKHGKSPYASLGALEMGRARVESKQEDLAIKLYRHVMENGRPKALRVIARERLARLLLDEGKPDEALNVIQGEKDIAGFEARYAETRGDIFLSLDRREEAIAAYQQALGALESGTGDRATLLLKLESLGVVTPGEETAS